MNLCLSGVRNKSKRKKWTAEEARYAANYNELLREKHKIKNKTKHVQTKLVMWVHI